ncbi:MAG: hypothetical protein BWY13_01233 [Euryarchaeota archaeon ADurb.Bin190]|nr:MAG: hypothetical protein BWY13_01233 [Euryarchaeota archaeon ADurb.Bin190]
MNAAVIELNALADAVWPASQDHDLALAAALADAILFILFYGLLSASLCSSR